MIEYYPGAQLQLFDAHSDDPSFAKVWNAHTDVPILDAVYRDTGISHFDDNPLITALPPIWSEEEWIGNIETAPKVDMQDLELPPHKRAYLVLQLFNLFVGLPHHAELGSRVGQLIRQGYLSRNPDKRGRGDALQRAYESSQISTTDCIHFIDHQPVIATSLIGASGVGKSTSIERILGTFPQVLRHRKHNLHQVVWLKVDCPAGGGIRDLGIEIIGEFDRILKTNYLMEFSSKVGVTKVLRRVKNLAATYSLGFLVIDELQNLCIKKSNGREEMLNFFQEMCNLVKVPVMQMGTMKSSKILGLDFRHARRNAALGSFVWEPIKDSKLWRYFLEDLFKYQWLKDQIYVDDNLEDYLKDLTQGIIAVVTALFMLAQMRAIRNEEEQLTVGLFDRIMKQEFKPILPMISALRDGDPRRLQPYEDMLPIDFGDILAREYYKIESIHLSQTKASTSKAQTAEAKAVEALVKMGFDRTIVERMVGALSYQGITTQTALIDGCLKELGFGKSAIERGDAHDAEFSGR